MAREYLFPNGVRFSVDHAARYCQTTFTDGAYVPATPTPDDDGQARTAAQLGYQSVWEMVWQHELIHSYMSLPGVSRVLWDVAHGGAGQTPEHWDEEARVLELQREMAAGRAGAELAGVLAELSEVQP